MSRLDGITVAGDAYDRIGCSTSPKPSDQQRRRDMRYEHSSRFVHALAEHVHLRLLEAIPAPGVTHLHYEVVR